MPSLEGLSLAVREIFRVAAVGTFYHNGMTIAVFVIAYIL